MPVSLQTCSRIPPGTSSRWRQRLRKRKPCDFSGILRLEVRAALLDDEYCAHHPGAKPGDYVALSVSDTGVGMDEETRERIFEPFFTTKEQGDGSGLGMSMVYGLVKQQNGYVAVRSMAGRGSNITVYFPVARDGLVTPLEPQAEDGLRGGSETILIVEDQEEIRRAGSRILRRFGYTVMTAKDGQEGLECYLAHETDIDLVISDVVMPRLGGQELYEELRKAGKTPRVLFMSAYSATELCRCELLAPDLPLLPKPWTIPDLVRSVRQSLDGEPQTPLLAD